MRDEERDLDRVRTRLVDVDMKLAHAIEIALFAAGPFRESQGSPT